MKDPLSAPLEAPENLVSLAIGAERYADSMKTSGDPKLASLYYENEICQLLERSESAPHQAEEIFKRGISVCLKHKTNPFFLLDLYVRLYGRASLLQHQDHLERRLGIIDLDTARLLHDCGIDLSRELFAFVFFRENPGNSEALAWYRANVLQGRGLFPSHQVVSMLIGPSSEAWAREAAAILRQSFFDHPQQASRTTVLAGSFSTIADTKFCSCVRAHAEVGNFPSSIATIHLDKAIPPKRTHTRRLIELLRSAHGRLQIMEMEPSLEDLITRSVRPSFLDLCTK